MGVRPLIRRARTAQMRLTTVREHSPRFTPPYSARRAALWLPPRVRPSCEVNDRDLQRNSSDGAIYAAIEAPPECIVRVPHCIDLGSFSTGIAPDRYGTQPERHGAIPDRIGRVPGSIGLVPESNGRFPGWTGFASERSSTPGSGGMVRNQNDRGWSKEE